jgi:hypothetical protein
MVNETQKTPLYFYKNSGGNEPVRDWLMALDAPETRHWSRPDAGTMALAGGHAFMPPDGAGLMGNTHRTCQAIASPAC